MEISVQEYYQQGRPLPLVDVRSPGEFAQGHIPGAVNIPLFDNEERARVGTIYKQQSQEAAVALGYELVAPKLQWYVEEAAKVARGGPLVVHCWRGGMRSRSFAQHLRDNGLKQVQTIKGGYKAYRTLVLNTFTRDWSLHILGGYTGSGKTHVIERLMELGHQAVDLEGLAHHKGSAFGAIGQTPQPSSEQFDNDLFEQWRHFDIRQPVWLEDESCNIGKVNIAIPLFQRMRAAPVYFLDVPREERAVLLAREYAFKDVAPLKAAVARISKRLGGLVTQQCMDLLEQRNFYEVALLTLHYYDKTYRRGLSMRDAAKVTVLPAKTTDPLENTELLLKEAAKVDFAV